MAIQTNIPLTDIAGLAVPANSYCVLDIHITSKKFLEATLLFYKSKADLDNGRDTFFPNNPNLNARYLKQMNNAEYAAFTSLNLHQAVQIYLETFFGAGTTTLVQ